MKITSNSHLLSSLAGLIDPAQRQQQQVPQDQQQNRQNTGQAGKAAQDAARQERINANRDALKKLQERLKADNIEKLRNELSLDNIDNQSTGQGVNLNLRESLGRSTPIDTTPGQIIDIRV